MPRGAGGLVPPCSRGDALHGSLRAALDEEFGGFSLQAMAVEGEHEPVDVKAVLLEDAPVPGAFVTLRVRIVAIRLRHEWRGVDGGVMLSVGGDVSPERALEWRAGRTIQAPVTFGRPARYLNDGVPDFERALALGGTTLFGSTKSGLLVEVLTHGSVLEENAARLRHYVRTVVGRWVAPRDALSAAIVTAVLIGDRTSLPATVRTRLQEAGTYHVIAISGGNIAILAGVTLLALMVCGVRGRLAAALTILALLGYAQVVTSGPSVWRATAMATLYLAARLLDHRAPPWHAVAASAALMLVVRPLDIRDPGFVLTFGATAALIEVARRASLAAPRGRLLAWLVASVSASIATEIALLPVQATAFSRLTGAGVLLNLLAVPAMAVVQVGGLLLTVIGAFDALALAAGWMVDVAASALVESARLVEVLPWLVRRVPPPPLPVIVVYYVALALLLIGRPRARAVAAAVFVIAVTLIWSGVNRPATSTGGAGTPRLRVTVFDVGQGDAMLVQSADGASLLVDAGGSPFGSGSFDIGSRVLVPALWKRGVRRLDALLVTHGDPDHAGGAAAVLETMSARELWEGVIVPQHGPTELLRSHAAETGVRIRTLRRGQDMTGDGHRLRVLHPPPPDWERQRVRNDDSVVFEIVVGDVAILLTGDIGAAVEQEIVPLLTPAPVRILKVAHHGSRTSTSSVLLEAWRPQLALVSCGRGNSYGHPAPEVLGRLHRAGVRVLRTDLHGQITIETDGHRISARTYAGGTVMEERATPEQPLWGVGVGP